MPARPISGRAIQLHALGVLWSSESSTPGEVADEHVEHILAEEMCDVTDRTLAVAELVEAERWERLSTDDGYRINELARSGTHAADDDGGRGS